MKKSILTALLATSLAGCISAGVQVKQEQLADFKTGVTTEADVLQKLGRPNATTLGSDGTKLLLYSYVYAQPRASSFIPIVGAFVGGADARTTQTSFRFDKEGKLVSFNATESQYGSGTGFSAGRPIQQTDQPRQ